MANLQGVRDIFPLLIPLALQLVPMIAKWIGGDNVGKEAQAVSSIVSSITGTTDPEAAAAAIANDPKIASDLKAKLLELHYKNDADERANQLAEHQAQFSNIQAQLADISNARARDVALQASGKGNIRADVMLIVVGVGLIACIIASAIPGVPMVAIGIISTVAGTLAGCIKDAFGFEFGSSRSSETKTGIIADLAQNTVPVSTMAATQASAKNAWAQITDRLSSKS